MIFKGVVIRPHVALNAEHRRRRIAHLRLAAVAVIQVQMEGGIVHAMNLR